MAWGEGVLEPELHVTFHDHPPPPPKARRQQMDLISELKRKQQKEPLIYESDRDGAIEDIITGEALAGPVLASVLLMLSSPHPRGLAASPLLATSSVFFSFSPPSSLPTLSAQDGALHGPHRQADVQAPL